MTSLAPTFDEGKTRLTKDEAGSDSGTEMRDEELLESYLATGSGEAFALLLKRHWPLVYGVAYRRTGNAALAQDIAQAVFIVLTRKCRDLSKETVLAGWLFRTTMFTANNALKAEARRRRREDQAALDGVLNDANPTEAWEAISKDLDEGLASLPGADRDALILRFLQDRPFGQVGEALGLNENAARQRVLRALEKLRRFLRKRGLIYPVSVLTLAFGARATHAAPAHGLPSNAAHALARQTLSLLKWKQIKTILGLGALLLLVIGLGVFASLRPQRSESLAKWRTIQGVDMTLWTGDGPAFSDLISLGKAAPIRARKAFAEYADALYLLRRSFNERFGQPPPEMLGSLGALSLLAGDKIKEQPIFNGRNHAVNKIVPGYSMRLIREDDGWKWDLFENATQAEANRFLDKVEYQTGVFNLIRREIDRDELADPEAAARALREALARSAATPILSIQ